VITKSSTLLQVVQKSKIKNGNADLEAKKVKSKGVTRGPEPPPQSKYRNVVSGF